MVYANEPSKGLVPLSCCRPICCYQQCAQCISFCSTYINRFAEFVEGSFHLEDDELLRYDSGDSAAMTALTSDEDSDDEIDFRLSAR